MAEATYNIVTKVSVDNSGFKKGVNEAQKSSKKLSSSINKIIQGFGKNGLSGAIASAGLALGGIGVAVNTAIKGFQAISKAIGECTNAYKNQLVVERALDTAISNSPFVSGSASKSLKEFASEMQRTSNLGDEEIIPMMTQLVATGRSEAEVMQIIKTASDMASSGAMSFDTAVTQLNATLNGNIGRLGQQNAELKGLTDEELKSGKAVEILAEKYKGLSQATIDTSKQLQNIKGDFKEALGQFTLPTSDMWNKFWTGFYTKGIEAINKINDAMDKGIVGKGIAGALETELKKISDARQRRLYSEDEIHLLSDDQLKALRGYLESLKKLNKEQEVLLQVAKDETESRVYLSKLYEEMDREEAERQKTIEAQKEAENKIVKLKEEYLKKIAEQEAKWKNIEAVTGKAVENEEKIKFYQDSLVDLMTKAGGQITTNNQLYKDQLAIIESLYVAEKKDKVDLSAWEDKLLQQQIDRFQIMKENELKGTDNAQKQYEIEHKYGQMIFNLKMEQLEREKELELTKVENTENVEEARLKILEYYAEQERILRLQNAKIVKEQNAEIKNSWTSALQDMLAKTNPILSKIGSMFVNLGKQIAGIFKKFIMSIGKIDLDDAMTNLLKFEDGILTFFVETLPKLPQFFESALQSISVLLANIKLTIGTSRVKKLITDLIKALMKYLPDIIKTGIEIAKILIQGISQGISENKGAILEIFAMITNFIISIMPDLILAIIKAIPTILAGLIGAVGSVILEIAKWIVNKIIDGINVMLDAISSIWTWIPGTSGIPHIPHFANGTDNAQRGLALVGEAGPELVDFRGGEKVYNNADTKKILSGGNGGNVFNVTFENTVDTTAFAMMKQLKTYQRNLAFNGVL